MTKTRKFFIGAGIFWLLLAMFLAYLIDPVNEFKIFIAKTKLEKLNYCTVSTECMDFRYDNGCRFFPINTAAFDEASGYTKNIDGQLLCDYFFRNIQFSCENQKCIPHKMPL